MAKFYYPGGVALDASGNVYVADKFNDRIWKLVAGTLPLVLAQSGLTGTAPVPVSLAIPSLLPGTTYYFEAVATNPAG